MDAAPLVLLVKRREHLLVKAVLLLGKFLLAVQHKECDVGAGLDGAQRIAISPDGRALFAASPDEDAVAVFSRKPASGRIALPDGATKCLGRTGVGGCDVTRGLDQPVAVAVGVRSDAVYVAAYGSSSLVVLRRRRVDGRLTQPGGRNACVNSSGGHGCTQVNGLQQPRSLLVLPGHGQWVEEQVLVGSDLGGVVELFRKSNGTIGQRPGTGGCVYWTAVPAATGCRHAPNVGAGASALARGTMPETVYVAAIDGVLVLRPRDPSRPGGYAPLPQPYGCVNTNPDLNCLIGHGSLAGLLHVAVNGRSAYTISIGGTVGVFRRVATER